MSEHTFKTIRDKAGNIMKIKASISNYKDVTVNRFNDKCYIHLSDVSKCFKQSGRFDLKKAKTVTLNKDEVNTFIKMTEKLPSVMDKVLAEPCHGKDFGPWSDSENSTDYEKPPKEGGKRTDSSVSKTHRGKKEAHQDSASETDSISPRTNKTTPKELKKKRIGPYTKPSAAKRPKILRKKDPESSDTDLLSD